MQESDVLVVGAGPTGLTMACELARHGITPRIIDKRAQPSQRSKAFGVHPRTLELFDNIGIVDTVMAQGNPCPSMSIYNKGKPLAQMDMTEHVPSQYPFFLIIAQSDTERILIDHLHSFGIEVERETELLDFEQDGDGVTATLVRPDGSRETARSQYLIGNDGAHSTVRKRLGLSFDGAPYPTQWLLADLAIDWEYPQTQLGVFLHPKGTTAYFPLYEDRARLVFEVPDTNLEDDLGTPTLDDVREKLEERGLAFDDVRDPVWLSWFRLHHRIVDRYQVGRVFVGGDAAHIHSPVGGQGMNTGIQDSYNLAWKLALVLQGHAPPALLGSYNLERHRIGEDVVSLTHRAMRAVSLHTPVLRLFRNLVVKVVSKLDGVQLRLLGALTQLELHYHDSSIVGEDWKAPRGVQGYEKPDHDLCAGERVPDFTLQPVDADAPVRLYDLLTGAEHELLLFTGYDPSREELAALRATADSVARFGELIEIHLIHSEDPPEGLPSVASTHVDPGYEMHRAFGAGRASIYLIRPDGYVGYRNQPASTDALTGYLSRIFTS